MTLKDFILMVIAVAIGVLIAGAIIAKVAAVQVQSSLQGNSILGLLSGLLKGSQTPTPAS